MALNPEAAECSSIKNYIIWTSLSDRHLRSIQFSLYTSFSYLIPAVHFYLSLFYLSDSKTFQHLVHFTDQTFLLSLLSPGTRSLIERAIL